jgi:solute:Na+ symporter, SSS family
VPLLAGAYWRRANTQGALCAIVFGVGTWLTANTVAPEAMVPPNLVGLFASIIGMVLGSLAPTVLANKGMSIEAALRHHGIHGHRAAAGAAQAAERH